MGTPHVYFHQLCDECRAYMSEHPENPLYYKCVCGFCKRKDSIKMNTANYISMVEFLMGRDKQFPLSKEQIENANKTVVQVNQLLFKFFSDNPNSPRKPVSSGYRPASINQATPNAAKRSAHMSCEAVDLRDMDKKLGEWCMNNLKVLEDLGLYMESLTFTHDKAKNSPWVHLQIRPTRNRVFLP